MATGGSWLANFKHIRQRRAGIAEYDFANHRRQLSTAGKCAVYNLC